MGQTLINVALLPGHRQTTANEAISGRAHPYKGGGPNSAGSGTYYIPDWS